MIRELRERVRSRVEHALFGHDLDVVERTRDDASTWLVVRECSVCGDRVVDVVSAHPLTGDVVTHRFDDAAVVLGSDLDGGEQA